MKSLTTIVVTLIACSAKPDELAEYNAKMKQALADAAPAYHLMATLQAKSSAKTDACTQPPAKNLVRISSHKLKVFAGEPSKDGWLVAKTDPVPTDPERTDPSSPGTWDEIYLPPVNAFPTTIMPYIADGPQRLAEQRAKLDAAPGFLVQVIDGYEPGGVVDHDDKTKTELFRPSVIRGRIVVFDKTGTPTCHCPYEATNNSFVGRSKDHSRYAADDLYDDLERQLTVAVVAALKMSR